ncbi:hypothetical protein [Paenibacillus terrae]|uniref:Uncharacterized protein n=2 Tax=Paenibacillus terrae TaxID=159743 RepID=G7VZI2_PAETH|nr:hypothetical protein HPL003_02215 [Paenibacillus terrae HPL-003]
MNPAVSRKIKRTLKFNHLRPVPGNLPLKKSRFCSWPHIKGNPVMKRIKFDEITIVQCLVRVDRNAKILHMLLSQHPKSWRVWILTLFRLASVIMQACAVLWRWGSKLYKVEHKRGNLHNVTAKNGGCPLSDAGSLWPNQEAWCSVSCPFG